VPPRRTSSQDLEFSLGGDDFALGDDQSLTLDGGGDDDGQPTTIDEAEALAKEELSEVLAGFKARSAREEDRFTDTTDSEYWVAVCFQSRAQKDEFLQKTDLMEHGDKYLDGMLLAERLGIQLEAAVPPEPLLRIDRRFRDLS